MKQGVVFRKLLGHYYVKSDGEEYDCALSSRLRKELIYPTSDPSSGTLRRVQEVEEVKVVDPVAVGDCVLFEDAGDGTGMIKEVLPRKNKLARYAAGHRDQEHIIAANVDQIIPIVSAAQPKPNWRLLDRYLVAAEEAEIPAVICITKIDLVRRERLEEPLRIYREIGYPVVLTSAKTGEGIEAFKEVIRDKISVLVGMSGVGKTTLLNAVQPGLGLRVSEVSQATGKGRHTTSHIEMFPLEIGGYIIDTPGIKTFGLWEAAEEDLALFFREMQPFLGQCKFRLDCTHTHEPGCAVKAAVEAGKISRMRYESYLEMLESVRPVY